MTIVAQSAPVPYGGQPYAVARVYTRMAGGREGGGAVLYWIVKWILVGPLLRLFFRPSVEGLENIPAEGPAILASNHLSFSDSVFLPLVMKRRITFLAKNDYFTGKGFKGWLTRVMMTGLGQVPVDRTGGRASEAAISTGMRILRAGSLLGIYPEGTRSPDGRLYRGKTGVARMALEAGVPVIPVAMIDTDKIQPIGKRIPRIMKVRIKIGAPLDFSRYDGMANDRFVLRSMTDELMYELMELSGREYADMYAQRAKFIIADSKSAKRAGNKVVTDPVGEALVTAAVGRSGDAPDDSSQAEAS